MGSAEEPTIWCQRRVDDHIEDKRTTCSRKNCKNLSLFTEPSKISNAIMPSEDNAGRMERRFPRKKARRAVERPPTTDHPVERWTVLLSTALSSMNTKKSGSSSSATSSSQRVRSPSLRSAALRERDFLEHCIRVRVREIVAREVYTPRSVNSPSRIGAFKVELLRILAPVELPVLVFRSTFDRLPPAISHFFHYLLVSTQFVLRRWIPTGPNGLFQRTIAGQIRATAERVPGQTRIENRRESYGFTLDSGHNASGQ
jgi:hypothetical protein